MLIAIKELKQNEMELLQRLENIGKSTVFFDKNQAANLLETLSEDDLALLEVLEQLNPAIREELITYIFDVSSTQRDNSRSLELVKTPKYKHH